MTRVVEMTAELAAALVDKLLETERFWRYEKRAEAELRERLLIALAAVLHERAETVDQREAELLTRIEKLLRLIGDAGRCSSCDMPIVWLRHKESDKAAPYTFDGVIHFANCPNAAAHRKSAKSAKGEKV